MTADNYKQILEEICEKIQSINSVKEIDITDIKNSVESIENLVTDTQAKLNFQEIKEKLESISYNIDSCNEAFIKNLYNDINELKSTFSDVGNFLENIQNTQNLAMTTAEFEEYQKQQLDLTLKTQDNIFKKLTEIKDNSKIPQSSEDIEKLEMSLASLHTNLSAYIEEIASKMENIPNYDELRNSINTLIGSTENNISQTNELLKDLQTSFSNFHADMKESNLINQISKIGEIYESLTIVQAWVEKAGFINKSLEDLYSKLGTNIDFDDVAKKVSVIFENISLLSKLSLNVDSINETVVNIESALSVSGLKINKAIDKVSEKLGEDVNFEDISNKVDIIYDNIDALNVWAEKIDNIKTDIEMLNSSIGNNISKELQTFNEKLENTEVLDEVSGKVDVIYENISALNDWALKIDSVDSSVAGLHSKITDLAAHLDGIEKINNLVNSLKNNIDSIFPESFDVFDIINKVDIIYDNLVSVNEWANKIDVILANNEKSEKQANEIHSNLSEKIDEIKNTLEKTESIIEDVPDMSAKLNELSGNLHSSLLDLESDFLKLHKFMDENTQITSNDIISLKECFADLNDDISSISLRTNKLILSADDANKEFKTYLELFKKTIQDFNKEREQYNPDLQFSMLTEKLSKMSSLMQNSITANNNLNRAFLYFAEWIDASGNVLNSLQNDINIIKTNNENLNNKINAIDLNEIKQEIKTLAQKLDEFSNISSESQNDEISELKSSLSNVIIQLNTSLAPNIDLVNEKIDKFSEDNNEKLKELEIRLNNKLDLQTKQLNLLTNKINEFNSKFDKLIEILTEDHKEYDMKDMLSYIVSEMSVFSEYIKNKQSDDTLKNIEKRISDFDTNINKLVSYVEED